MLDEVGGVPQSISDSFFRTVRGIYNSKETSPEFEHCVFILAGSFIPSDLIKDRSVSPFNIAETIYMSDAGEGEIRALVRDLEKTEKRIRGNLSQRIYQWTAGHLYLTQRLCSILAEMKGKSLTEQSVDKAVEEIIADDDNIKYIYIKLDEDKESRRVLAGILGGRSLRFGRSSYVVARLDLIGVIKKGDNGNCMVRNEIYEKALRQYYELERQVESISAELPRKEREKKKPRWQLDVRSRLTRGVVILVVAALITIIANIILYPLVESAWQPRRAFAHFPDVDVVVEHPTWIAVEDEQDIEVMLINKSDRKLLQVKVFLSCTGVDERHIMVTGSSGSSVIKFTNLEAVIGKQARTAQITLKESNQLNKIKLYVEVAIYTTEGQLSRRRPPIQAAEVGYIQCVPVAHLGKNINNVLSFLTSLPGQVSTLVLTWSVGLILDNIRSSEKEQEELEAEEAEGQTEG